MANTGIYTQNEYRNDGGVVQKFSKEYRDVSLAFIPNPLNGDLTLLKDERAINNSLKNIIMFLPGEVPFDRDIGSHAQRHLFDLMGEVSEGVLQMEIERAILFCEPRVTFTPYYAEMMAARPEADPYFAEQASVEAARHDAGSPDDLGVVVVALPGQNAVEVLIKYRIVGDARVYRLQEILTPTR